MNDVDAFVGCHGRMATHRVNLKSYVSGAPKGSGCFTRFGDDLLLCESCTGFWLHHLGLRQASVPSEEYCRLGPLRIEARPDLTRLQARFACQSCRFQFPAESPAGQSLINALERTFPLCAYRELRTTSNRSEPSSGDLRWTNSLGLGYAHANSRLVNPRMSQLPPDSSPKPGPPANVPGDSADDPPAFGTPALSQERYAEFFETFPHYCYVISPNGTILDVNPAACEALGYAKEELLGKPLLTIYAPESLPKMRVLLERWTQCGAIRDEEMVIRTKEGQKRTVLLSAGAVKDASGNLLHSTSVQIDITEQRQTQEKLRASEEHLREVVQHSPVAMLVTEGSEQRNILMNDRFTGLFGYTRDDVPDVAHWWPLAYPDAGYRGALKAEWEARVEKAFRDRSEIEPMEALVRCKDGSKRNIEFHFSALTDINIVSFIDVTDRKQAESVLQENEQRFRLVANTAPVMIWMSSTDKLCNYFNSRWLEFTGRALEQELGNGWAEGVHQEDVPRCLETYTTAFDRRESFQMEYRLRRHDGEYRWIHDVGVPRFSTDGAFTGYIGSCIDITERKLAEEALSAVSGRILEAQDQERARIARELHDDINQRLALVAMELDRQQQNPQASADELRGSMAETKKQVSELAGDIHAMSHSLHPAKLDFQGLAAAARGFCREFAERQQVEITFRSEGVPKKVPEAASLCLFRVLQEALQNAVKHSGTRHFRVSLDGSISQIGLTVRDKGRGFRRGDVLDRGGLGLTSMRERLKLAGGKFDIDAKPHRGTIIRAFVPLKPQRKSGGPSI